MRMSIETGRGGTLRTRAESSLRRAADDRREGGPARPPSRDGTRPWPAPGDRPEGRR